jgi:uncharacterized protein (TIGR02996 family)
MTTEDAFLQDILKDPYDTGPQRIYADWLEEHDRTLEAEFIRVQCEMARLRAAPSSPWRDFQLLYAKHRREELLVSLWNVTPPQGPEADTARDLRLPWAWWSHADLFL